MEGRPSRGRGGQWRRGGSAVGNDSGAAGDRRGRGRGGHHRGRGKRDHYRGRGRGFYENGGADFFRRTPDEQDDKENTEDEMPSGFSRRKLESNWTRYEETEKEEVNDDVPVQRGTDYHVLLTSAGDSFTQFRFSEEKDWEADSLETNQVPALFVDLEVLARSLQELPLYQRLVLEPSLVQESTPVELPTVSVLNRVHPPLSGFKPTDPTHPDYSSNLHGPRPVQPVSGSSNSTVLISSVDDAEEELDLLLGIQKSSKSLCVTESKTSYSEEELSANLEQAASPVQEMKKQVVEQKENEYKTNHQTLEDLHQKSKQKMTEEDLEDWLDSMIS